MSKRIFITGAAGMLGQEVVDVFRDDRGYSVFGSVRVAGLTKSGVIYKEIDLRQLKNLKKVISEVKPDIIIHCAAIVNLNICEENKKEADLVHVKATKVLASYNKNKTKFVFISTDSVFDGKLGGYSESSRPRPLNYYAKSKLKGENAARAANKNALIIRTNIYGFHNPVGNSLAEWAIDNFALKKTINGFTDVIFNPVYTKQLARIIKYILDKKNTAGILNVGSTEQLSKYEFLKNLAGSFKLKPGLVRPALIGEMNSKIVRPKNTTLKTDKLIKILNGEVPTISEGIREFTKDYLKNFKL